MSKQPKEITTMNPIPPTNEREQSLADFLANGSPSVGEQINDSVLRAMREWIADCDPLGLGCFEDALAILGDTAPDAVLAYVSRNYDGGIVGFLLDSR